MDALIPPRQSDYAQTPANNEPEKDGYEDYVFDTDLRAWVCSTCDALVASPPNHTAWHARLDKIDTA